MLHERAISPSTYRKPRSKYRFVTRELFAGIAVIAVALAWAFDHWRLTAARNNAQDEMRKQAAETKRLTDSLWAIQATHTAAEEKRVLDAVGFGSRLVAGHGYHDAKTLAEALEIAKSQLIEDGKPEFVPLLTEERVRAGVLAGIASYSAKVEGLDKRFPSENVLADWVALKPTLQKIAETGTWPSGCTFTAHYGISDNSANYDGLMLQIILKPSINGPKAGVPVINLDYGRYE